MSGLLDLVAMTVSSAFGTSTTIPLGSGATINGVTYLSFSAAGASSASTLDYSILDTGNSEIGTATWISTSNTLVTRTPTKSTNGNAAITASSAAIVLCSPRAESLFAAPALKADQQTATASTLAVTPLHQQDHDSACKAWATWGSTSGTIIVSYNVSSVTRTAAGTYTVNFTTNFASSNYVAIPSLATSGNVLLAEIGTRTSSNVTVFTALPSTLAVTGTDSAFDVSIACFGRQ